MKRRMLAAAVMLAALAAAVFGFAFFRGSRPPVMTQAEAVAGMQRDQLYVMAHFEEEDALHVAQTFTLTNRTGENLSEIVLRVLANGDEYLMLAERAAQIAQVKVNDRDVHFALEEDDPTVLRVRHDWAANETIELVVTTQFTVDLGSLASEITLPSLSIYEDGAWRADEWDSLAEATYGPAMDVTLRLEYPAGYEAVFGGARVDGEKDGDRQIALLTMPGARDVTFSVARNAAVRYRQVDGVQVAALADGVLAASRLLDTAQEALRSLEAIGLAYPLPALTIVQAENEREDGRVYSGLVVMDAEKDGEARLERMTRLIARQTFGVLVGNDPWNAPWLSQSLASTAELLAYRARRGQDAYETRFFEEIEVSTRLTRPYGVTVGAGIEHFGGDVEMAQVLRDQGAAMLLGIEQAVGSEAFMAALGLYIERHGGQIADRSDFEAALYEATGSRWDGYLEDELSY